MASQTRHPIKATVRTGLQVLLALCVVVPLVLAELGVDDLVIGGVSIVGLCVAFTRIMALPSVEAFLQRFVPWLAADPDEALAVRQGKHEL